MIQLAMNGITCCWPGYRQAWYRAHGPSLTVALGFGWFVAWLLICTFVWREWMPGWTIWGAWVLCLCVAVMSFTKEAVFGGFRTQSSHASREENFVAAQSSYLQASYFEAEKLLLSNLSSHASDIESALLLVSVYRRTERWDHALEAIQQLQRREMAARWTQEIAIEKERCLRGKRQTKDIPPPAS